MKLFIFLISLGYCHAVYPQAKNTFNAPDEIVPIYFDKLALYPGAGIKMENAPLQNPRATYSYKGKDYYIQSMKNGYCMRPLNQGTSREVLYLKKVDYGSGFLFIDDTGNSYYANFDKTGTLVIEYYNPQRRQVEQFKIVPNVLKSQ